MVYGFVLITVISVMAFWRMSKLLRMPEGLLSFAVNDITKLPVEPKGIKGERELLFKLYYNQQRLSFALLFFTSLVSITVITWGMYSLLSQGGEPSKAIVGLVTGGIEAGIAGGSWKLYKATSDRLGKISGKR